MLALLEREAGLTPDAVVADIGAGTGRLAELFLGNGNRVLGVEPNREMREAGARLLARWSDYAAVDGRAEATGLPATSVDFIVVGQAFHWFEPLGARAEFRRILRPGGGVALVWNMRREDVPFMVGYEDLLRTYGPEYPLINDDAGIKTRIHALYGAAGFHVAHFPNAQYFDLPGLEGLLLSSSSLPEVGHPDYAPMLAALARLFAAHAQDGQVTFAYDTIVYYGRLDG